MCVCIMVSINYNNAIYIEIKQYIHYTKEPTYSVFENVWVCFWVIWLILSPLQEWWTVLNIRHDWVSCITYTCSYLWEGKFEVQNTVGRRFSIDSIYELLLVRCFTSWTLQATHDKPHQTLLLRSVCQMNNMYLHWEHV